MSNAYLRKHAVCTAILSVFLVAPIATLSAHAQDECSYERAYSVDGGQVTRQGDNLIIEVWGNAPGDGWTKPKLAVVPQDSNALAVEYRLVGCAPLKETTGGLHPIRAGTVLIAMPGRIRGILIQAATNDLRLKDATP